MIEPSLVVPSHPDQLTAQWLSEALKRAGVLRDAQVQSASFAPIAEGHGFVSRSLRCRLSYDRKVAEAPRTVVAKFATDDEGARTVFVESGLYEREVRFYRELRDGTPVAAPRCYTAEWDGATGGFILLLEDLAPAVPGDPLAGCSVEEARAALDVIARMHIRWWEDQHLDGLTWLPPANPPRIKQAIDSMYGQAWAGFSERAGKNMPESIMRLGARLQRELADVLDRLSRPPWTFVHGDYQLGNVFFSDARTITAVTDWQVIIKARGVMDVAHFIARSLDVRDRRAAERDLVRGYHEALLMSGVEGYSFRECWDDYRLAVVSQFGLGVLLSHGLMSRSSPARADPARDHLAQVVGARLIAALVDLRPHELLERAPIWRRISFLSRTRGRPGLTHR